MKNKINAIASVISSAALILLSAIFFSCGESSGLGPEVDLTAPVVSITSHEDDDYVSSCFTLKGTAYDNEAVTEITIDFSDAGLYYKITPGQKNWYKKTSSSDWTEMGEGQSRCISSDGSWDWEVYVDTSEASWDDSTFELTLNASDALENTGKTSTVTLTLIVDKEDPDVMIYSPDLFTGSYEGVKSTTESYSLCDGNVISKLLNGDLTLSGRQSNADSFKQLRIEFDNGSLSSGTVKATHDYTTEFTDTDTIAQNVDLGDEEAPTVYYSKTLRTGDDGVSDLRNWSMTINASDWSTTESGKSNGLDTGKRIIRVISTSISDSGNWQRKVIGYFVWWPEADKPWIKTYTGDEDYSDSLYEIYPSANFTGSAQDDDGIASLTYKIEKTSDSGKTYETYTDTTSLTLSEDEAKYSAWSFRTPSQNGEYRVTLTVTDLNGESASITRYFKILDVQPPSITVNSPESSSSVLSSSRGDIDFDLTVSDDGTVDSLVLVYLNPNMSDDVDNQIKYLSGTASEFDSATADGYTDSEGNILFSLTLPEPTYDSDKNVNVYSLKKTLNIFDDLKIDGTTKCLETLNFIFRAKDNGGSNKVVSFSLSGDSEAPRLTISTITLYDSSNNYVSFTGVDSNGTYTFGETPTLPKIKDGYYALLTGTWSDNSTSVWTSLSELKISDITFIWGDENATVTPSQDGTWTKKVTTLPTASSSISVSITDFGGNTKKAYQSVMIESTSASLERIGSNNDDGSYKEGDEIEITLEFNKSVTFTGANPSLTLNNKATAAYSSGNRTSTHVFKYTVSSGEDIGNLGVSKIVSDGTSWADTATSDSFTPILPASGSSNSLESSRNICVDTVSPKIESITAISSNGYYKEGDSIILKMTFSENVDVDGVSNLALVFSHQNNSSPVTTDSATVTGSKTILFTYTVASGDNASPLTISSISNSGVTITDEAGNALVWTLPAATTTSLYVDTKAPPAPTVDGVWGSASVVTASSGTSFTISGEENATIEYSIDNGENWQTYSGTVSLKNNGTYNILAKQTDQAGNESEQSSVVTVTVDKGDLLTAISATTVNGTYSTSTNTKAIEGTITFRKAVTIEKGATVTLNVGNSNDSSTSKTVPINECSSSSATNTLFTFTYTISDGDYINTDDDDKFLDVTGWSFNSVTYSGNTVDMTFNTVVTDGKAFKDNREIKILTGVPSVKSVSLSGTGSEAILTVTFDREISKNSGNIVITQREGTYRAHAVLTTSEYNSLPSSAQAYYSKGTNGATLNSDNTLTNDTATKYVLDYNTEITDSTLVDYLVSAGLNSVSIPVVSSAVSLSSDEKSLVITLGSTYELPTMGVAYDISIPESLVVDATNNANKLDESQTVTEDGVEAPVIRIQKSDYTINNAGSTLNATLTLPDTAKMKIDCRTPGTTISYSKNEKVPDTTSVISVNAYKTKTDDALVSTSYSTYSSEVTLGATASTYGALTGLKVAIAAKAEKNSVTSDLSYEYATRSVLKFNLDASSGKYDTGSGYAATEITENSSKLNMYQLQIWIQGGDSASGTNTISTFPLSWGDFSNYKLMKAYSNNAATPWKGQWAWCTWDLSAGAYHGFTAGDVPSDAQDKGPTTCYVGECSWNALKSNYILYPGECVEMCITSSTDNADKGAYFFRTKNKLTR